MEVAWQAWQARPPQASLTVVVKATYDLPAEGIAALAEEQALVLGDLHHDDDPERSLRYASDLEPLKPCGEWLVLGSCHVPGEQGVAHTKVRARVGSVQKELAILRDRAWSGVSPSVPQTFNAMPLSWERAFGGVGHPENPVGRGLSPGPGEAIVRLPNVEDPQHLVVARDGRPPPAGFGPRPRTWMQRMRHAGTYDAIWHRTRYPWFPADLDWRFFLAAPEDQRIEGYYRGDEEIELRHLHPVHASLRCRLPGHAPQTTLVRASGGATTERSLEEVGLRLDTIVIDADLGTASCVWRGVVEVPHEDLSAFRHLFVVHSDALRALSKPELLARYQAKLEADAAEDASLIGVPPPAPPAAVEGAAGDSAGAPARDEAAAPGTPTANGSPPVPAPDDPGARWAHLDQAMTIRGDDGITQRALRDAMAARMKEGKLQSVFDDALQLEPGLSRDRELSPEELLELEMMESLGDVLDAKDDPRRAEVLAAIERGESLAGADLAGVDLSGCLIANADLRGARLTRANLSGAQLERCQLDGAILSEAELSLASLDGCSLRNAELVSVRAHRVRIHGCHFDDAVVLDSYLRESRWLGASLLRTELGQSEMSEADFRECDLFEADLTGCALTRATFSRCRLEDAWMEGVSASAITFDGCQASLVRLAEGADLTRANFKRTALDGARFCGSNLREATFKLATLTRADFTESHLDRASLVGCDLRSARFDGATLTGASLLKANLMHARFEGASLRKVDLRGANLYQAELMGAVLEGARLDLANVVGTRIEESDA